LGLGVAKRWKILAYISCSLIAGDIIFLIYHYVSAQNVFWGTYR
jgi:hypothetical protein